MVRFFERMPRAMAAVEVKSHMSPLLYAETEIALDYLHGIGVLRKEVRLTRDYKGRESIDDYYWLAGRNPPIPGEVPPDPTDILDFEPDPDQEQLLEAAAMVADEDKRLTRALMAEALGWSQYRLTKVLRPIQGAGAWPFRWLMGRTMTDSVAETRLSIARDLKSRKHGLTIFDCEFDIVFGESDSIAVGL
jgi:hypothetical protein